jgi:adenylate kinase family enzyme
MQDFAKYRRIIVVGSMGSGKSWLSKHIAEITGYPLYHLDVEFWRPNWVMSSNEEKAARMQEIISGEKWIIDGNYDRTMEMRFTAADLIIFLDMNRLVCIWSVAKRSGKKRSDLPNYLEEPTFFSKIFFDTQLKMIWTFPKTKRKTIMDLHEKYPEKEFLHIKSRRRLKKILKNRNE